MVLALLSASRLQVDPTVLSAILGVYAPEPLELVFLNGCRTDQLGRACYAAGVPTVVCWETRAANQAASIFSRCFFEAVSRGDDYPRAFEQAKHGVSVVTRAGQDARGLPCQVPKFEFRDPDAPRAPPVPLPVRTPAPATASAPATAPAPATASAPAIGTSSAVAPAPDGARALSHAASPAPAPSSSRVQHGVQPIAAGVPLLLHRPGKYV